ncbi:hypothetical protein H5410_003833 [Solanum commersonii]|uniref:Gag-pol polyprotein n=1 Tax=Solanum commersonii TaxID=4109 RepID=A0A9J6B6A7_SOLCO|nr:hypothetical protein H5410_003833 [Solanum commersonii]
MEAKVREFLTFKPESTSVHEYSLNKEGKEVMLIGDMDISRLMNHVQQVEEHKLRDRKEFWNKKAKTSRMSVGSRRVMRTGYLSNKSKRDLLHHLLVQLHQGTEQSQGSIAQGGNGTPACSKCCRTRSGMCRDGSTGCFKCGKNDYFMKEFPKSKQGNGNGAIEPNLLQLLHQTELHLEELLQGTSGRSNNLYAITSSQKQEDSPDVVTVMIKVFNFDVYALLDLGVSLSL